MNPLTFLPLLAAAPLAAQNCLQLETSPTPTFNAEYGFSVAMSDSLAVAGAPGSQEVNVYARSGGAWSLVQTITPNGGPVAEFGYSLDIEGDLLVVGAKAANVAQVFRLDPMTGQFGFEVQLTGSDIVADEAFGQDVSIEAGTVFVAAAGDDPNGPRSGAVYVFSGSGSTWTETYRLFPPDGEAGEFFGVAIDTEGDTLVVGALFDDDGGTSVGSAYVYDNSGFAGWSLSQKLQASDGAPNDFFGVSVAVDGTTAIIGSEGDDDNGQFSGSAYVFERDASLAWTEAVKLLAPDGFTNDDFGFAVAIEGTTVDVAARAHQSAGAVYRFDLSVGTDAIAKYRSLNPTPGETFGSAVDIASDLSNIIGSAGRSTSTAQISGAIYFPQFAAGGIVDCNGNLIDDACDLALGTALDINANGVLDECEAVGSIYCTPNAQNSTGTWAKMIATGSAAVADNDLTILVSDLPQNSAGYFFASGNIGFVAFPGSSQGILCMIGGISRFGGVQLAGTTGTFDFAVDLNNFAGTGPAQVGHTWYVQTWYRDANPTSTSNFSDGIEITFL
ncbi:hypothetical protein Poly30_32810 [Planctomycetes bacterium Poly30]|uniref:FG-GAP repeat protein n=1 Tax=Saltatorellus ferox TaxID=2528018 RepID=A0A518EUI5_9BACT|nr:hypothetical protein Poly30_32810 [Planctomycetes bacterium Poly30]